ncbi:MAG: DEAD/DEAH box helicase [Pseudobdellovibrio sp.]
MTIEVYQNKFMKYVDLELDSRLQAAISALGYSEATPIQQQSFLPIVQGKDVAGLAQTGTGKTAAFLIPLIERILKAETQPEHERAFKDWTAYSTILILVPTRELADQIHENIKKLTQGTGLKSFPLYGGTGYEKQKEALSSNLQFIVSTPGRLIDLYKEHFVDFKKVKAIVFDEADRMFDMGFKDDMKYILSRIERNRQFLVFSATLNFDVLNTAYQFGSEPVEINISKDVAKADNVKDAIFHIGHEEKPQHLLSVLKKENPTQTIIFTNFKNNVDRIAHFLTSNGIPAMGISSLMSQSQRNLVISKFKETNNQNVLVATDVAARGLDISNVDLVINYELPQDCESYVHRIGRTGRAGQTGKAFSLVCDRDVESLSRIEEYTKKKIEIDYLEDGDLIKDFKGIADSEPRFKKSFDSKNQNGGRSFKSGQQKKTGYNKDHDKKRSPHKKHDRYQNPQGESAGNSKPVSADQRFDKNMKNNRGDFQQRHDKKPFHKQNEQNSKHRKSDHNQFSSQHKNFASKNQNKNNLKNKETISSKKSGLGQTVKSFFKRLFG